MTRGHAALAEQIADYRAAPDEYLQARAADLVDLRDRVLARAQRRGGRASRRFRRVP